MSDYPESGRQNICVLFVFIKETEADVSRLNHSAYAGEVNVTENKNRIVLCVCVQKIPHTSGISCALRDKQSGQVRSNIFIVIVQEQDSPSNLQKYLITFFFWVRLISQ